MLPNKVVSAIKSTTSTKACVGLLCTGCIKTAVQAFGSGSANTYTRASWSAKIAGAREEGMH